MIRILIQELPVLDAIPASQLIEVVQGNPHTPFRQRHEVQTAERPGARIETEIRS